MRHVSSVCRPLERICGQVPLPCLRHEGSRPNNPVSGSSFRCASLMPALLRRSSSFAHRICDLFQNARLHRFDHPIHLPDRHEMIVPVLLFSDHQRTPILIPPYGLQGAVQLSRRRSCASISATQFAQVCKFMISLLRSTEAEHGTASASASVQIHQPTGRWCSQLLNHQLRVALALINAAGCESALPSMRVISGCSLKHGFVLFINYALTRRSSGLAIMPPAAELRLVRRLYSLSAPRDCFRRVASTSVSYLARAVVVARVSSTAVMLHLDSIHRFRHFSGRANRDFVFSSLSPSAG